MRRPRLVIRGRRGSAWLALAAVAALVAAGLTLRAAARPDAEGTVLVATANLPAGLLLDGQTASTALAVAAVPSSLELPGLLRAPAEAVGRRVAAPVAAGEPITEAALGGAPGVGPEPLAVGERAVAVPLSAAGGAAAGIGAGARVDVVASTGEGPAGRTAIVVGDAEVLAVAQAPAVEGGVATGGEVLLRVSAAQALRITAALNFAREVRLLVRPQDEVGQSGPDAVAAP